MAFLDYDTFARFEGNLRRFASAADLTLEAFLSEFTIEACNDVTIAYAPVHYVNEHARVLIVGITPGWTQAAIALRECARRLRDGCAPEEACRSAKYKASFAGSMRRNLLRMLDQLGVTQALGLSAPQALFDSAVDLLDTGSVLPYPVFVGGRNYSGYRPALNRSHRLWRYADLFREQLRLGRYTLIVPLGKRVASAIQDIGAGAAHCLYGFPHPSGANGHRQRQFERRLDDLRRKVAEWADATAVTTCLSA